jgi:hypothetical protein
MKPIDHSSALCPHSEYRRISDKVVHPSEVAADIATIRTDEWKPT